MQSPRQDWIAHRTLMRQHLESMNTACEGLYLDNVSSFDRSSWSPRKRTTIGLSIAERETRRTLTTMARVCPVKGSSRVALTSHASKPVGESSRTRLVPQSGGQLKVFSIRITSLWPVGRFSAPNS